MINNFVHKILWNITEKYPHRVRDIQVDGSNYLRRFYLTPRRLNVYGEETGKDLGFGVYLHYFYKGDEDRELHNHPWERALSFVLLGGYYEERRTEKDEVILKDIKPLTFNYITKDHFHRVIKKKKSPHVWTIFFTGKRVQNWGFWDRDTKDFIPQEEFIDQKNQGYKKRKN